MVPQVQVPAGPTPPGHFIEAVQWREGSHIVLGACAAISISAAAPRDRAPLRPGDGLLVVPLDVVDHATDEAKQEEMKQVVADMAFPYGL